MAIVCAMALQSIYRDLQATTQRMMTVLEQQAQVNANANTAMFQLRQSLEDLAKEARLAHRSSDK